MSSFSDSDNYPAWLLFCTIVFLLLFGLQSAIVAGLFFLFFSITLANLSLSSWPVSEDSAIVECLTHSSVSLRGGFFGVVFSFGGLFFWPAVYFGTFDFAELGGFVICFFVFWLQDDPADNDVFRSTFLLVVGGNGFFGVRSSAAEDCSSSSSKPLSKYLESCFLVVTAPVLRLMSLPSYSWHSVRSDEFVGIFIIYYL